jgi:hypothetical protein
MFESNRRTSGRASAEIELSENWRVSTRSAFARGTPALALTYGSYEQLDGVADRLAKFIFEGSIDAGRLAKGRPALKPAFFKPE